VIEEQLQLSPQRRQDLLRLLRFAPEGQALITRYGWSEWTLRPLHMAISAGELQPEDATAMLRALAEAPEVNAPVVAALVERHRAQAAARQPVPTTEPPPRATIDRHHDESDLLQRMARARRAVDQLRARLAAVEDLDARPAWQDEAQRLRESLEALLAELPEA
jgi:hypothetical protein